MRQRLGRQAEVPFCFAIVPLLFFIAVSSLGLSSGESRADTRSGHRGILKARQWSFRFIKDMTAIELSVQTGYCVDNDPPFIEKVDIAERPRSAVLTAFVRYPPPAAHSESCAGVGVGLVKTVSLKRPIQGLALYDGKTSPPTKRWPKG